MTVPTKTRKEQSIIDFVLFLLLLREWKYKNLNPPVILGNWMKVMYIAENNELIWD